MGRISENEAKNNSSSWKALEPPVHKGAAYSASSQPKQAIKKRKYSRAGCKECKRRKMKCDEGKPFCYNCSRLNKACVYEVKRKFRFENVHNNLKSDIPLQVANNDSRKAVNSNSKNSFNGISMKFYNPTGNNEFDKSPIDHKPNVSDIRFESVSTISGPPDHGQSMNEFYSNHLNLQTSSSMPFPSMSYPLPNERITAYSTNDLSSSNSPSYKNTKSNILDTTNRLMTPKALNSSDIKEIRNLFDEASLLVNDINDLISLDWTAQNHSLFQESMYNTQDSSPMVPNNKHSSESTTESSSETYEKHNFQIEEFTDMLINNNDDSSPANVQTPQTSIRDDEKISNTDLINETLKHHHLSDPHISYLSTLVNTELSYHLFPFASSINSNEVVKMLLKYSRNCPYLLTSLLAISATFQYNKTSKSVHDLSRQKYISACLKSLSGAFSTNGNLSNNLAKDIERFLLTVLVLTSNFTATSYIGQDNILNSWKTHLRGAKDLLTNYSKLTKTQNINHESAGLALAKTWFFAIETVASIYSPLGGTLTNVKNNKEASDSLSTDTEEDGNSSSNQIFADTGYFDKDLNPYYHEALAASGLLISNSTSTDFNLYIGFSMDVVYLVQEFIKALDSLRSNDNLQISSGKIAKLMGLMHKAKQTEIVPKVSKTSFIIPKSSPMHPDFPNKRIILPSSAYGKRIRSNNEIVYYSWFDISEQLHVDSLYLKLLVTKGLLHLPSSHPLIKELLNRIMNYMFFIEPKSSLDYEKDKEKILIETENFYLSKDLFDNRCIMIQSPFRLCSRLVDEELDFEKLELFFLGLAKLGNGSSLSALDTLHRYREKSRKKKLGLKDESVRFEIEDGIDEDEVIPFA